jgi:hypothetical protein
MPCSPLLVLILRSAVARALCKLQCVNSKTGSVSQLCKQDPAASLLWIPRFQSEFLQVLNSRLGINDTIQPPKMRPSEEPEQREEVTDADIMAYVAAQEAAAKSVAGNALDGFAGSGGVGSSASGSPAVKPPSQGVGGKENDKASEKSAKAVDAASRVTGENVEALVAKLVAQFPPTPIEKAQRALNERKWVRHIQEYRCCPSRELLQFSNFKSHALGNGMYQRVAERGQGHVAEAYQ